VGLVGGTALAGSKLADLLTFEAYLPPSVRRSSRGFVGHWDTALVTMIRPFLSASRTPLALAVWLTVLHVQTRASDVTDYSVAKGIQYLQTSADPAALATTKAYFWEGIVNASGSNTVSGVSLLTPYGAAETLLPNGTKFSLKKKYNSLAAMGAVFPSGNYFLTIYANRDGNRLVVLPLAGDAYPLTPHFADFAALQNVDDGAYNIVRWDALAGGTTADLIQFRLEDQLGNKLFETPDLGKEGAMDGTATYAILPPGNLGPGATNVATLIFGKIVTTQQTNYPGATGRGVYLRRTKVEVKNTRAASVSDVRTMGLSRSKRYQQLDSGAPALELLNVFNFALWVEPMASNTVSTVVVSGPGGQSIPLVVPVGGKKFQFSEDLASEAVLTQVHPEGIYQLSIFGLLQPHRLVSLNVAASDYPAPPHLANFNDAQAVAADQDFVLSWDPIPGATAGDYLRLHISDSQGVQVFQSDDFGKSKSLKGTATSMVLPARTFIPGKSYSATLQVEKLAVIDVTSYPGSLATVANGARTQFRIQTIAPDVKDLRVTKGQVFSQTGAAEPVPASSKSFYFELLASAGLTNGISQAMVTGPGNVQKPLPASLGGTDFLVHDDFPSRTVLDQADPNGIYAFSVQGVHNGQISTRLSLTGDAYPNAPHLLNYWLAQALEPAADNILSWDPMVGGTANDREALEVFDSLGNSVFTTRGPTAVGSLSGLSNSVAIPHGTLVPNQVYSASLIFEKAISYDATSYPGTVGMAAYATTTQFGLGTRGPGSPPSFTSFSLRPDGAFQLTGLGLPNRAYRIDVSTDALNWQPAGQAAVIAGRFSFLDDQVAANRTRFYRAALVP